ncbi:MAG TPA: hypothetical protein PKO06_09770, partial [Candidatus Ozemobacteraceae bacterium]|nr:hypothetical protein [Candidatus Ozemobacteraceae bacterium]
LDAGVKLTGAAGKRIMRFGLQYPKWGARALKVAKKVGWDHADVTLVALGELLVMIDTKLLMIAGLAVWLWCFWLDLLGQTWAFLCWLFRRSKQPEGVAAA